MTNGRRSCLTEEIEAALHALDTAPYRVMASAWPADLRDLERSGLYAWWVDARGAADLSEGLGIAMIASRIYAGQTGATAWPSGIRRSSNLRSRIGSNHLRGRISASTFRRTLASVLEQPLQLLVTGTKTLDAESEQRLSRWMREHLEVAVHVFLDRDALGHLEVCVLRQLDPPLNLDGLPTTAVRTRLAAMRRNFGRLLRDQGER